MPLTVLVTGASSGIGQAIARLLAERGFNVFGTARKPDAGRSSNITMVPLDVRSDDSVRSCVQQVLSQTGRIDVLVNNAGYNLMGAAEETSIDEAKAQLETNFWGAVRMVNAVLPAMRKAGTGELRPLGISVSVIEPGFVHTAIGDTTQIAGSPLTAYDPVRNRATSALNRHVNKGIAPEAVARTVLRAVESRTPSLRYRVGTDAVWLPRVKSVAPWRVFAAGVRRTFDV